MNSIWPALSHHVEYLASDFQEIYTFVHKENGLLEINENYIPVCVYYYACLIRLCDVTKPTI